MHHGKYNNLVTPSYHYRSGERFKFKVYTICSWCHCFCLWICWFSMNLRIMYIVLRSPGRIWSPDSHVQLPVSQRNFRWPGSQSTSSIGGKVSDLQTDISHRLFTNTSSFSTQGATNYESTDLLPVPHGPCQQSEKLAVFLFFVLFFFPTQHNARGSVLPGCVIQDKLRSWYRLHKPIRPTHRA